MEEQSCALNNMLLANIKYNITIISFAVIFSDQNMAVDNAKQHVYFEKYVSGTVFVQGTRTDRGPSVLKIDWNGCKKDDT